MHIDMDAFFASVEQLDFPELRGLPVVVGGESERGVLSAASYEARKFGLHSAMSSVKAKQLCPQAVFRKGRMHRYKEISQQVMAVLEDFSPVVEKASVDEAYLDATGLERLFGPIDQIGKSIKERVKSETGLNCSVGAAPVKFLAKIASDLDKPDGLSIIHPEGVTNFLKNLPVKKVPGVGKQTLVVMKRLGVRTCGDVLNYPQRFWDERLGKFGHILYERAQGIDPTPVSTGSGMKSSSAENTFHEDTVDRTILDTWLLAQAERVGADLRKHEIKGRTITLKVKYSNFKQITRSRSLDTPTDSTKAIHETALKLLDELELERAVRLIGVGVSNFGSKPKQLSLLGDEPEVPDTGELDRAVDAIRGKFGNKLLTRGDLLDFRKKR